VVIRQLDNGLPSALPYALPDAWSSGPTKDGLVLFSVKASLRLWALVSIFSEWFTEL